MRDAIKPESLDNDQCGLATTGLAVTFMITMQRRPPVHVRVVWASRDKKNHSYSFLNVHNIAIII